VPFFLWRQIGGAVSQRCGSALRLSRGEWDHLKGRLCGLRKCSGSRFLSFGFASSPQDKLTPAAHAHVPTSSLRSVVGPGVSARSPRSVEMTRGWLITRVYSNSENAIARTSTPCKLRPCRYPEGYLLTPCKQGCCADAVSRTLIPD